MKRNLAIAVFVILALLGSCENPFIKGALPDNTPNAGPDTSANPATTYKIYIDFQGRTPGSGDNVTAAPLSGQDGEPIILNYTLANTHLNNRLDFQGTITRIPSVDSIGSGTRLYMINKKDAVEGEITITAVFSHSSKKLDPIEFEENSIDKVYGDLPFTNAIKKTYSGTGAISYESSDTAVASVSSAGLVTILKAGRSTITATKAEDDTYARATASYILTVSKADGSEVSVPTAAAKTHNSITVNTVTLTDAANGQTAEYAISAAASPVPENGWQDGRTFSSLTEDTDYYVFARSKGNDNFHAGTAKVSAAIRTEIAITISIIKSGNAGVDSVSASPAKGIVGDKITINYTLALNKINNQIDFFGTTAAIAPVYKEGTDGGAASETGAVDYTISSADAKDKVITINAVFTHSNKKIDRIAFADNENVSKVYGDPSFTKAITNNGQGSGAITYSSSVPAVATVDNSGTVTIVGAGTAEITATKAQDDIFEHATAVYTLTVSKKTVTITGLTAKNKVYDGKKDAEIEGTAAIAIVSGDTVTVTKGTAAFADKTVGDAKIVTFSGFSLGGASAGNYSLPAQPADVTANITKLQLTVTHTETPPTKVYDGTKTAEVSITGSNKISTDTLLTITAVGTFNSENVAEANSITIVYTLSGDDAVNYISPVDKTINGASITKAPGSAVSVPTPDRTKISETVIAVRAVTLLSPDLGQSAEYAKEEGTANSVPPVPLTGWQNESAFTVTEDASKIYYVFARSKADNNCTVGTAQVSAGIKAMASDPNRMTIIDFETALTGISFTKGDNDPTVTVVAESNNPPGTKALQISTKTDNNNGRGYNQAAIIPVNLPLALSSYESVSFKFMLVSGNDADLADSANGGRTIDVYAASSSDNTANNTAGFKQWSFGNLSGGNSFADKLVGRTPKQNFSTVTKNTWIEYTIDNISTGATASLTGNIFIAIGINLERQTVYLFDDITFALKDSVATPPPSINPDTAAFDKNTASTTRHKDIDVTMTPRGRILTSITNGEDPLTADDDYTQDDNVITLKKEYLATLPEGTATLTFNFGTGNTDPKASIVIAISDTTPPAGGIIKYDYNNFATIVSPYPKFSGSGVTLVQTGSGSASVLTLSKITGHSTVYFTLLFNIGTKSLTDYSGVKIRLKGTGGDYNNKGILGRVNLLDSSTTVALTSASGGNLDTFQDRTLGIPASLSSYTGAIEIGIAFDNTPGFTAQIESIELVLK